MTRSVSGFRSARTPSEGINFGDLEGNEVITKEMLQQVLGITDPGDLSTQETYVFTVTPAIATAASASSIVINFEDGLTPVTSNVASGASVNQVLLSIISALSVHDITSSIYNYNISGNVLTISNILPLDRIETKHQITASPIATIGTTGLSLEVTRGTGTAGILPLYQDILNRRIVT